MGSSQKENIWNIPNCLTFFRILISFVVIFFIFADFDILYIVSAFVVGMITDALDGQIARRFNLKTEFGRQFDMVADRLLMIGSALAVIIKVNIAGLLTNSQLFQIFLVLSREIICFPVIAMAVIFGKGVPMPKVRLAGKITTVMQAIAFLAILLGIYYDFFRFSLYLSIAACISGAVASFYYTNDIKKMIKFK